MEGIKERRKRNTAVFGKRESGVGKKMTFLGSKGFLFIFGVCLLRWWCCCSFCSE